MRIIESNTNRKILFSGAEKDAYSYIVRSDWGDVQLHLNVLDFLKNDFSTIKNLLSSEILETLGRQMGFLIDDSLAPRWLSRDREETYYSLTTLKKNSSIGLVVISFGEGPPNHFTITLEGTFILSS